MGLSVKKRTTKKCEFERKNVVFEYKRKYYENKKNKRALLKNILKNLKKESSKILSSRKKLFYEKKSSL